MPSTFVIQPCTLQHADRYGAIYAEAFAGEPWNDAWTVADATTHVRELLESKQAYGLECVVNEQVAGFVLGSSMLFHYGRSFEVNDLAVARQYQHQGIGRALLQQLLDDLWQQGISDVHLITAAEGTLPHFYESFGFEKAHEVMLMGCNIGQKNR